MLNLTKNETKEISGGIYVDFDDLCDIGYDHPPTLPTYTFEEQQAAQRAFLELSAKYPGIIFSNLPRW